MGCFVRVLQYGRERKGRKKIDYCAACVGFVGFVCVASVSLSKDLLVLHAAAILG